MTDLDQGFEIGIKCPAECRLRDDRREKEEVGIPSARAVRQGGRDAYAGRSNRRASVLAARDRQRREQGDDGKPLHGRAPRVSRPLPHEARSERSPAEGEAEEIVACACARAGPGDALVQLSGAPAIVRESSDRYWRPIVSDPLQSATCCRRSRGGLGEPPLAQSGNR